jgi:hypothetical protein
MENIDPDAGEISAVLSVSLVTLHFTHQAFKD